MSKSPAALSAADVPARRGSLYPPPFDAPCAARERQALGDPFGLSDFGVNRLVLPPGAWSSQRHWHSAEDEFVYVLEGSPTLITDDGERTLAPGEFAGFPAGSENGHHLVNRTDVPAIVIEVGSRRAKEDDVVYSDIDMQCLARGSFTRRNGEPY